MIFVRFTISKIRHFQVSLIPGGGGDSNAEAVLEVSVVNNLSLPVVCGVFLLLLHERTYTRESRFVLFYLEGSKVSIILQAYTKHGPPVHGPLRSSLLHIIQF